MPRSFSTWTRALACLLLCAALLFVARIPAHADVYGRLRIVVRDADSQTPLGNVTLVLHDNAGVHGDESLVTDTTGAAVSPLLENRSWQITASSPGYDSAARQSLVAADTVSDVVISLPKHVIKTKSGIIITRRNQTTDATHVDRNLILKVPVTAGNPQSLPDLLKANPGFVGSTVNAVHPRGEHASTTIYVDGFLLPGTLQGRAGQQISPTIIQGADILTGAYAPEYGSETAAILNLSLRAGTIKPFQSVSIDGGDDKTYDGELSFGGQGGSAISSNNPDGPHKFRYLLDLTDRSTANALEAPQPDNQEAHNGQTSATIFGNFGYAISPKDDVTLFVNSSPAHTQIANRTGLSSQYDTVGEGYGYGGARNIDGTEPGTDPMAVGGQTIALPSQQADYQDVYQNDDNSFLGLNYRHTFSSKLTGLFSVGADHSGLDIYNHNPSINLNSLNPDGTLSVIDNSIEFNPTVQRVNTQKQVGGSLTLAQGIHTYKAGFILQGQVGDEMYQFTPQSQLALDALNAVQQGGPQLAPAGTPQVDSKGNPILDALGNQLYLITPGATTPVLHVHRSGYYNAAYVQDTWRASRHVVLNYGLRLDGYGQKQNLGQPNVNQADLSPRFNLAILPTTTTTFRLSYDKTFTQPPIAQGAILGTGLRPQLADQYEASIEKQLAPFQSLKYTYFYKNDHNQNDTGILIPYTQIGAYTTLQYQYASVHSHEISYNLTPRNNVGLGGYLAYTNSHAAPGGLDQTGGNAPTVNDHDQTVTETLGLDYTLRSQNFIGGDVSFGSGEASSVLAPIAPSNGNVLNAGKRNSHYQIDLRLGAPHLAGQSGLELDVQNLTDQRSVLNFNSGFSGTRFQQGRRVLLRLLTSF